MSQDKNMSNNENITSSVTSLVELKPTEVLLRITKDSKDLVTKTKQLKEVLSEDDLSLAKEHAVKLSKTKGYIEADRKEVTTKLDRLKKLFMVPEKDLDDEVKRHKGMINEYIDDLAKKKVEVPVNNVLSVVEDFIVKVLNLERLAVRHIPQNIMNVIRDQVKVLGGYKEVKGAMVSSFHDNYMKLINEVNDIGNEEVLKYIFRIEKASETEVASRINSLYDQALSSVIGSLDERRKFIAGLADLDPDKQNAYFGKLEAAFGVFVQKENYDARVREIEKECLHDIDTVEVESHYKGILEEFQSDLQKSSVSTTFEPIVQNKEGLRNALNYFIDNASEKDITKLQTKVQFVLDHLAKEQIDIDGVFYKEKSNFTLRNV